MKYYLDAWQNYANFEGRVDRKQYWMFILFQTIAFIVVFLVSLIFSLATDSGWPFALLVLYFLATLVPTFAIRARRLHDAGFSGWWQLLTLVSGGDIVILIFTILESAPDNKYGPNPHAKSTVIDVTPSE